MGLPAILAVAAPLISSAVSSIISSSGDDEKAFADQNKVQSMLRAGQDTERYRGEAATAQMQSLANRMSSYQGANNALATMYGPGAAQAPGIGLGPNALGLPLNSLQGPPPVAAPGGPPGAGGGPPPRPAAAARPGLAPPNQLSQRRMPSPGGPAGTSGTENGGSPFDRFLDRGRL